VIDSKRRSRFIALDALRGFAALAIAVFHYHGNWGGYLAVDFFLILSGFVLSHVYLNREKNFLVFLGHRLARLYPLHLFSLFVFVIVFFSINGDLPNYYDGTVVTFIQHLTLTQNIGLSPSEHTWNYPSWSISVEFWVNIVFILFITRSSSLLILIGVSLCCFGLILLQSAHLNVHHGNYFSIVNSGLVRGLASFVLGVLVYRVYSTGKVKMLWKDKGYIEAGLLIGILICVFMREDVHSLLDFLAIPLFALVILVFAQESGIVSKLISKFDHLGIISYSLYLNQIAVLMLIRWLETMYILPEYILFAVYLTTLLVYSHFTYIFIELPARKYGRAIWEKHVLSG